MLEAWLIEDTQIKSLLAICLSLLGTMCRCREVYKQECSEGLRVFKVIQNKKCIMVGFEGATLAYYHQKKGDKEARDCLCIWEIIMGNNCQKH